METKKCKFCQVDIPKKAKVCPNCKRTLKSHGCLVSILVVFVFFGIGITVIVGTVGRSRLFQKSIQKEVSGVSNDDEYMSMNEYNSIDNGMTYEQVKEIVGSTGEVASEVEANGINITIRT